MKMETQMNQKKYFVGIDIGTTKIVAVVGAENQFGKLEILGYVKPFSKLLHKHKLKLESLLQRLM